VSASELNESQPILGLFGPTNTQRAAFGKPREEALNNPAMHWELGFTRNRTGFSKAFVATAATIL